MTKWKNQKQNIVFMLIGRWAIFWGNDFLIGHTHFDGAIFFTYQFPSSYLCCELGK
jgi:hypothetical protein